MRVDRFGRFLVVAIYCVAVLCLLLPVVAVIVDPDDPGHVERFIAFPLLALGVAVVGKGFSCLVVIAQSRATQTRELKRIGGCGSHLSNPTFKEPGGGVR